MRWGLSLVALLIAMAVVLTLSARSSRRSFDRVAGGVAQLDDGAAPILFDRAEVDALATRLGELCDEPDLDADELREVAARAAGWVAGARPGTGQYRAAVRLRGAAGELSEAGPDLDDPRRAIARALLAEVSSALDNPAPMPGGPAGAIRDQLDNLQRGHAERLREATGE